MTFLGVTAVEDILQWQAPETISRLRDSGIKVWICTGDKMETSQSVARACGLTDSSPSDPTKSRELYLVSNASYDLSQIMLKAVKKESKIDLLIINGSSLAIILSDITGELKGLLL